MQKQNIEAYIEASKHYIQFVLTLMTSPHGSSSWVACLQSTVSELVTELFNLLSSGEAGLFLFHTSKIKLWTLCKVKDAVEKLVAGKCQSNQNPCG